MRSQFNRDIGSSSTDNAGEAHISLTRHRAQCGVCRSEFCDEITEAFLAWHQPATIISKYSHLTLDALYRHARALDLIRQRRERAIEGVERVAESAKNDAQRLAALKVILRFNERTRINQLSGTKAAPADDLREAEINANTHYGDGKSATDSNPSPVTSSVNPVASEATGGTSATSVSMDAESVSVDPRDSTDQQVAPMPAPGSGQDAPRSCSEGVLGESVPLTSTDSAGPSSVPAVGG